METQQISLPKFENKEQIQNFIKDGGTVIGVDVDTQFDFVNEGGSLYVPACPKIITNIGKLSSSLKTKIGSVDSHSFDAWEFQENGGIFPPHCVKGTNGWLRIQETQNPKTRFVPSSNGHLVIGEKNPGGGNRNYGPNEFASEVLKKGITGIFEKEVYSLFANPNADPFVRTLVESAGGINKVLFATFGYCTGNYCVDAAAGGLKERGYNTAIIEDASAPLNIGYDGKEQNGMEVTRKLAIENRKQIEDLLEPFDVEINGVRKKIGIILCEDMWSDDYSINPTKILIDKGAEIIINLSCSPWTWRKNNKRNRVIRNHLKEKGVHYIYCNNVGTQNNGKNIFLFDGNSTVYNPDGSIAKVANDYLEELLSTVLGENTSVKEQELSEERDLEELYNGLIYGIRSFFESKPSKKVVIGLSGGIDSALVATLLTKALGKENVYAVNMPSQFNSNTTKNAAQELAKNLGINYGIFSIQDGVDLTIDSLQNFRFNNGEGLNVNQLTKENIQARDRGSRVLAGIASGLGAMFTNNGNKTEVALGYATLYGDVNGAIAPIGDLYKGEVYALSRYINKLEGKNIIPQEIIDVVPSAELSSDQNVDEGKGDPIIYEYHDKLLRAFVEFRKDPAVSKRAFGFDFRESQNGVYFSRNYKKIKEEILLSSLS